MRYQLQVQRKTTKQRFFSRFDKFRKYPRFPQFHDFSQLLAAATVGCATVRVPDAAASPAAGGNSPEASTVIDTSSASVTAAATSHQALDGGQQVQTAVQILNDRMVRGAARSCAATCARCILVPIAPCNVRTSPRVGLAPRHAWALDLLWAPRTICICTRTVCSVLHTLVPDVFKWG